MFKFPDVAFSLVGVGMGLIYLFRAYFAHRTGITEARFKFWGRRLEGGQATALLNRWWIAGAALIVNSIAGLFYPLVCFVILLGVLLWIVMYESKLVR